jgi:hypothetical protein
MQAALDKGGSECPTADLLESPISSNNLDFGRNANAYLNCLRPQSFVCDPSPGGLQEKLEPALVAAGAERQRLMAELADRAYDEVLFLPLFETPVTRMMKLGMGEGRSAQGLSDPPSQLIGQE